MNKQTLTLLTALSIGTVAALPKVSEAFGGGTPLPTIVDVASGSEDFDTLTFALTEAGLVDTLNGPGPFTVFAPTDGAFDNLPAGLLNSLLLPENEADLVEVLTYHVIAGAAVPEATAITLPFAEAINGQRIPFAYDPNFGFFVDGAEVVTTDIQCSNGVIHVITDVMIPALDDIVTTSQQNGNFTTLNVALRATGLKEPLKETGDYTVFAPLDSAFADLPDGTIAALLAEEDFETLSTILTFHVVPGRYYADELADIELTTLEGGTLNFRDNGTHIGVNGGKIVIENVVTSNGMIHVIDKVLLAAL